MVTAEFSVKLRATFPEVMTATSRLSNGSIYSCIRSPITPLPPLDQPRKTQLCED